jgi:hypothetical protein
MTTAKHPQHEVYVTPKGATHCAGAATVGTHVVVFIDHTTDAGERCCVFVPLDAHGRRLGDDAELRVEHRSGYLGTIIGVGGRALVALTERHEERLVERNELHLHDRASLLDIGTPRRLNARTVGSWDVDVGHIGVTSRGDETAWTMLTVLYGEATLKTCLAYAYGARVEFPLLHKTDIPCSIVAHAVGESEIAAVLGTSQKLELWLLPRSGEARCIADVAHARSRRTITDARILPLRDGYALIWYVSSSGSMGAGGGLWARSCSMSLTDLDEPVRVARDDDASWSEWRAYDVGDGALVLYGSGEPGDPVRQLRWREREDLANTNEARPFPGKLPAALAATPKGAVVITEHFSAGGRRTRLSSKLVRF